MRKAPGAGRKETQVSPNAKWILLLRIAFISGRKGRRPGPLSSLSPLKVDFKGTAPSHRKGMCAGFSTVFDFWFTKLGEGHWDRRVQKSRGSKKEGREEARGKRREMKSRTQNVYCTLSPGFYSLKQTARAGPGVSRGSPLWQCLGITLGERDRSPDLWLGLCCKKEPY